VFLRRDKGENVAEIDFQRVFPAAIGALQALLTSVHMP
jgi:hypothetical protein